ncbi:MAG: hypothetical protein ACW985_03085 [Candidatus Thorarchaeota archaeon]
MIEQLKPKQVFALSFAVIMLLVPIIGPGTVEATQIPFSNIERRETISPSSVTRDYWPTEAWRYTTPFEQDLNEDRLNSLLTRQPHYSPQRIHCA